MATTNTVKATNISALMDAIDALSAIDFPQEKMEKLEKILDSFQKKAKSASGKSSGKAEENAEVGQKIVDSMEMGHPYTLTELLGFGYLPDGATTSKVRATLSSYIRSDNNPDGIVVGEVVKGRTMYSRV